MLKLLILRSCFLVGYLNISNNILSFSIQQIKLLPFFTLGQSTRNKDVGVFNWEDSNRLLMTFFLSWLCFANDDLGGCSIFGAGPQTICKAYAGKGKLFFSSCRGTFDRWKKIQVDIAAFFFSCIAICFGKGGCLVNNVLPCPPFSNLFLNDSHCIHC